MMNTESVDCKRIQVPVPEGVKVNPGDFAWDFDSDNLGGARSDPTHYLYVCLPGSQYLSAIQVRRGEAGGARMWGWNGDEDKPTIVPSIHAPDRWHGYLVNGRLVSC